MTCTTASTIANQAEKFGPILPVKKMGKAALEHALDCRCAICITTIDRLERVELD